MVRLRAAGCVFAEEEAALLTQAATGAELDQLVAERVAGSPLEQVLGWAEFCGLRIVVEPGVFVPRRRTALLVREALALTRPDAVVVDLCCGTGAVAAAVCEALPGPSVYAADIDPAALRCARRNLGREQVFEGDLYDALPDRLRGRVDVLTCNAPYVPSTEIRNMPREARDHEPEIALDGGADGLAVHGRVAAGAGEWLAPGGALLVETSRGQAPGTRSLMEAAGFAVRVVRDDELGATVAVGIRPGAS